MIGVGFVRAASFFSCISFSKARVAASVSSVPASAITVELIVPRCVTVLGQDLTRRDVHHHHPDCMGNVIVARRLAAAFQYFCDPSEKLVATIYLQL